MARRPLKSKPPKPKNSLKVVKTEREKAASEYEEDAPPPWTTPSASWLKLDEARLNHWRAKLEGGDVVATLKAWADLLHVPKTRMTNGTV